VITIRCDEVRGDVRFAFTQLTPHGLARIRGSMRTGRSFVARMRHLVLAALLLVPLIASGHHHADAASPSSCAVCVATHHAPAAVSPAPATFMLAQVLVASPLPPQIVPASRIHSPIAGRAPPSSSSTLSVS
jgi:hypothetical protein